MSSIRLEHVSLSYPLLGSYTRSLKKSMMNLFSKNNSEISENEKIIFINALKDINFELSSGDRLGLIGRNGAGKSTLLRVLAGIYPPTNGRLFIHGNISPLLGINVGMNPLATGYENIKFRCLLHRFDKKKIQKTIEEVEEFTELGRFLAMPLKTYSSGMSLRLSFGIATTLIPDILLLDEVVGVGDAHFIEKAQARLNQLIQSANIMVLASHSEEIIKKFCNKILWLDEGSILQLTNMNIEKTLNDYRQTCLT